jgi:uncharacterized cupredoxin-like copper-binding protein
MFWTGRGARPRRSSLRRWCARVGWLALALAGASALGSRAGDVGAQTAPVVVAVDLSEWLVTSNMPRVPAGVPVRFVATNRGGITHALSVTGVSAQTSLLAPGEDATLEVVFASPGAVQLFCPLGGGSHRQRGMEAALEVTAAPAGQTAQATPAPPPAPTAATRSAVTSSQSRAGW